MIKIVTNSYQKLLLLHTEKQYKIISLGYIHFNVYQDIVHYKNAKPVWIKREYPTGQVIENFNR